VTKGKKQNGGLKENNSESHKWVLRGRGSRKPGEGGRTCCVNEKSNCMGGPAIYAVKHKRGRGKKRGINLVLGGIDGVGRKRRRSKVHIVRGERGVSSREPATGRSNERESIGEVLYEGVLPLGGSSCGENIGLFQSRATWKSRDKPGKVRAGNIREGGSGSKNGNPGCLRGGSGARRKEKKGLKKKKKVLQDKKGRGVFSSNAPRFVGKRSGESEG